MSVERKMDNGPSDEELVRASQAGDTAAYGILCERYFDRLVHLSNLSFEDAKDCAQEALIRGWDKIDTFKLGRQFYPWLRRIHVNIINDFARMKNSKSNNPRRPPPAKSISIEDNPHLDLVDMSQGPDRVLEEKEIETFLRDCLKRLSEAHASVWILRVEKMLTFSKIADSLSLGNLQVARNRFLLAQEILGSCVSEKMKGGLE